MTQSAEQVLAVARLREAVMMWVSDFDGSEPVIDASCHALVVGVDSPALRELAGLPRSIEWLNNDHTIRATFDELGLDVPDPDNVDVRLEVLAVLAARCLSDQISTEDLLEWSSQNLDWEASPHADRLYKIWSEWEGLHEEGWKDSATREAAWNFLRDHPPSY